MRKGLMLWLVILLSLSGVFTTNALAGDHLRKHAVELSGFGGWYIMEGNQWLMDTFSAGGRIGFFFTRNFETEISATYTPTQYATSEVPYNLLLNGHHLDMYHIRLEGLYHLGELGPVVPFLAVGAGATLLNGVGVDWKPDPEVVAGGGVKIFLTDWLLARGDVRYIALIDKYIHKRLVGGNLQNTGWTHYNDFEATAGLSLLLGGKSRDSDGDGIPDKSDECPNTPAGVKVDSRGCPVDSDGDGVPDYLDKCPDTPAGTEVDASGCPIPEPPPPPPAPLASELGATTIPAIQFKINSAQIDPASFPELDKIATYLLAHPTLKLEIDGYTDTTGPAEFNRTLSQKRAEAVDAYIESKGVPKDQLVAKGFGEANPIASNATREGREKNRRVEFKVVQAEQQ